MDDTLIFGLIGGGVLVALILGILAMTWSFYEIVEQGTALIVNKTNDQIVTFTGAVVMPVINKAERMDIAVKTLPIVLTGKSAPSCSDCVRVDVEAKFYVRVNRTVEDVLKVAQSIGCKATGDEASIRRLFEDKFIEAVCAVVAAHSFDEVTSRRDQIRDAVIKVIGEDLGGYVLEDAAFSRLEMTPAEHLDENDIRDAKALRIIAERVAEENLATDAARHRERIGLLEQQRDADRRALELEGEIKALQAPKGAGAGML